MQDNQVQVSQSVDINNMHETMGYDIPRAMKIKAKEVIKGLNKYRLDVQGWIVNSVPTDAKGMFDKNGGHLTGFFICEGDPRDGQLITTAKILTKTPLQGYSAIKTDGINPLQFYVLDTWETEIK